MSEPDRVAMLSDLIALENRLQQRFTDALEGRIAEEGKTTRRYFDIMVERVESVVKLVADVNSHHAVVLDDHEARLKSIEKRRG
jgi:uncharacterized protein YceH (UPF0502 family)